MLLPLSSHAGGPFGPFPWWLIVILFVDLLIIVWILRSRKPFLTKLAWIAVIFFTHAVGWILYFFLGRERR